VKQFFPADLIVTQIQQGRSNEHARDVSEPDVDRLQGISRKFSPLSRKMQTVAF
jgi:hypothetical protein